MQNNEGSVGPIIATIIILAVVVLGGLYFWGQHKAVPEAPIPTTSTQDDGTQAIQNQSSSDDSTSIQGDLENTNTNLDAELQAS